MWDIWITKETLSSHSTPIQLRRNVSAELNSRLTISLDMMAWNVDLQKMNANVMTNSKTHKLVSKIKYESSYLYGFVDVPPLSAICTGTYSQIYTINGKKTRAASCGVEK